MNVPKSALMAAANLVLIPMISISIGSSTTLTQARTTALGPPYDRACWEVRTIHFTPVSLTDECLYPPPPVDGQVSAAELQVQAEAIAAAPAEPVETSPRQPAAAEVTPFARSDALASTRVRTLV